MKSKSKSKANLSCSIRDRHVWELVQNKDHTISQSLCMKMQNPTISSCTKFQGRSGNWTFWSMKKSPYFGYCPEKHMTRPELHMFIHIWWTQMKNMMNPDEDHHERNNILKFIRDQNVCPEFQVKACGTQDTWHNTTGHPTTAIWAQGLYKYSSKAQHYLHHCKAYKKTTLILFEALANWNWSISKAFIT